MTWNQSRSYWHLTGTPEYLGCTIVRILRVLQIQKTTKFIFFGYRVGNWVDCLEVNN